MATGYTHPVKDGTITDLQTFVLQCARAFGALIEMRDDPMDAPIPESFKPSPYHADALAQAEGRLAVLPLMTERAKAAAADSHYRQLYGEWEKRQAERVVEERRYRAMLAQVEAWTPPTVDHEALKKFMVSQLTESIEFDCRTSGYDKEPQPQTADEWFAKTLSEAERAVAYHKKHLAEEQARAADRTKWVRDLRNSLEQIQTGA